MRTDRIKIKKLAKFNRQFLMNDFDITQISVLEFGSATRHILDSILEGVEMPPIYVTENDDGTLHPIHPKATAWLITIINGVLDGWITHPEYGSFPDWSIAHRHKFHTYEITFRSLIAMPDKAPTRKREDLIRFMTQFMCEGACGY